MDATHGIMFGLMGTCITIVGFYIAYNVAYNSVMKSNKKKKPSPVDGILKYINNADDCQ